LNINDRLKERAKMMKTKHGGKKFE